MGRPAKYASAAERQAAYRERQGAARQLTVLLPEDVAQALDAYMTRNASDGAGETRSEVVVRLLRTQLLRKR
jgi:hypothetical protein